MLNLKPPQEASPAALVALWPIFLAYALSFTLVAIYWVNHHHLLHAARQVSTATLWLKRPRWETGTCEVQLAVPG